MKHKVLVHNRLQPGYLKLARSRDYFDLALSAKPGIMIYMTCTYTH